MQKTLGGDRLGSGKKMKVELRNYERSTHDLSKLWRSTMSAGTLVPFLKTLALPGDTFDIDLDVDVKTHPTRGPLFGSYKVQLDVFTAPIRLYQGQLHNNKLDIGLNMSNIKLPQMSLWIDPDAVVPAADDPAGDIDNCQINPSCILSYLGIRGVGLIDPAETEIQERLFNAVPLLAYWDIYKNYYANKQEELGYVIHNELLPLDATVTAIEIDGTPLDQVPGSVNIPVGNPLTQVVITYAVTPTPLDQIIFNTTTGQYSADTVLLAVFDDGAGTITGIWNWYNTGTLTVNSWTYAINGNLPTTPPKATQFILKEIDQMREGLLAAALTGDPVNITDIDLKPTSLLLLWPQGRNTYLSTQEGLGLKTYQSDMLNNWLSTDWIDGPGGINEITAIDTTGGSINIDTILLSKKVYDMLNQIAVSGGTYDDWLNAVYSHESFTRAESPVYHGGLIRELTFQEVVSNSSAEATETSQPLGTLAGKGVMTQKKKGGHMTIRVDEPSYIIGIISLTPRIDNSQGNDWDTQLKTMDDLHKPAMDEIGFEDLIQEKMAWWTTYKPLGNVPWVQQAAGKQPSWMNYRSAINETRGNFAIATNEMFMTLNRRYEYAGTPTAPDIADLTTYIDPTKFNNIFAVTSLDAQNFWVQIAADITARRKMSARLMPNL